MMKVVTPAMVKAGAEVLLDSAFFEGARGHAEMMAQEVFEAMDAVEAAAAAHAKDEMDETLLLRAAAEIERQRRWIDAVLDFHDRHNMTVTGPAG